MNDTNLCVGKIHPDALYPITEICRIGRFGRTFAYRAMHDDPRYRGKLPHLRSVKLGGARRIRGADYLAWLDALAGE
jgi:hypothetical protein